MATGYLDLINNIATRSLVAGRQDRTPRVLPPLLQGSTLMIRYSPVIPLSQTVPPFFEKVSIGSVSMEMIIGPRAGDEDAKAKQVAWTKDLQADPLLDYFVGVLSLNTVEMNTFIGASDAVDSFFEIRIDQGNGWDPVYQQNIKIISSAFDPTGEASLPEAASNYYTQAQQNALFIRPTGNVNGTSITLPSKSGVFGTTLWTDDDGSFHADQVIL